MMTATAGVKPPTIMPTPEPTATAVPRGSKPTPTPFNPKFPGAVGDSGIARRPADGSAGAYLTPNVPILPTPTPVPLQPLPGFDPVRLRVPSLGISARVEYVGLDNEKRMDVPKNIWNVGWYKLGVRPGERGNAVFAGHVDGPNTPAVFWDLRKAQVNTKIYIQDPDGEEKVFEVFDTAVYEYDKAPLDRIFGASNEAQVVLITCTGTFDQGSANYDKRFVAYARLVNKNN